MRRLTLLAVAGMLGLYACSDQNTESPTEPTVAPPSEAFGSTCSHGQYPFTTVAPLTQDSDIFKSKPAKTEALLRLGTIALLWNTCNDLQARQAALSFLTWIDQNKAKNASQTKVEALKAAVLEGFGAGAENEDFVSGLFLPGDPAVTQYFTTSNNDATISLKGDAFDKPTIITVRRKPNNAFLLGFPQERQRPPFYDYDATNSATDNTVQSHSPKPGTVVIGFCFEPVGADYTPENARIGHNPVDGTFEFVTEILPPADIQAQLSACPVPSDFQLGSADHGFGRLTHRLIDIARTLFLPAPLRATTVGTRGPIAGTPISLSPFGLVLPDCEQYYGGPTYFCLDSPGPIN